MEIVLNNLIPFKNFYKLMIELYLSKVTENSESEQAGIRRIPVTVAMGLTRTNLKEKR
jgi:hypothetical protein